MFVAWIAALRAIDGATCRVGGLVIESALAATWTGGLGIALAAANARSLHDRASGVDAQLLASGAPVSELARARIVGAARRAARTMLWPVTAAGIASLAAAGSLRVLLARLVVVGLAAAYALVVGAALGATGALSDELAPRRGTLALCAVLALLAIVAGWLDDPRLSLEYVLRRPIEVALGGLSVRGVP